MSNYHKSHGTNDKVGEFREVINAAWKNVNVEKTMALMIKNNYKQKRSKTVSSCTAHKTEQPNQKPW